MNPMLGHNVELAYSVSVQTLDLIKSLLRPENHYNAILTLHG